MHFKCTLAPIAHAPLLLSRTHSVILCATHATPNHGSPDKPVRVALAKRTVSGNPVRHVAAKARTSDEFVGEVGHGNFLVDSSIEHPFDPNVSQDKRQKEYADLRSLMCTRSNLSGWSCPSMSCPDQPVRLRSVAPLGQTSSTFGIIEQRRRWISSPSATSTTMA